MYVWANKERYEGQWANDKMNGKGVFSFANGAKVEA